MKKLKNYYMHYRTHHHHNTTERRWIFPLVIGSVLCLFIIFLTTLTSPIGASFLPFYRSFSLPGSSVFVESKLQPSPVSSLPPPPRFAYMISGSVGDGKTIIRTLLALYHPNNVYVVHLDREAPDAERLDLQNFVNGHHLFVKFNNVKVITKANLVTYRGPTMVANTLHGAAILLREGGDWDWFINLSASDYPLMTQDGKYYLSFFLFWWTIESGFALQGIDSVFDFVGWLDLLHTFSYMPRDLNFIDHTSNIGWKE